MRRTAGAVVLVTALAGLASAAPAQARPTERVIVRSTSAVAAAGAVRAVGGRVLRELPLVDAVAAEVPQGARVRGDVSPDATVRPQATEDRGGAPRNLFRQTIHANDLPATKQRDVTVAIIDTGVDESVGGLADNVLSVPDPNAQGKTARCANFSGESGCGDGFGHGTFLAGLIAGEGPYPGVAPDAKIVSVKIAGREGAADTSALLAAIQYVVSFKDQLGIQVLNLSLGTDSNRDYRSDPLNLAVAKAWDAGITVVVSASNRGPGAHTISKPADDPLVITVGAVDENGTTTASDDTVAPFSGRGTVEQGPEGDRVTVAKPDVAAPGVGLVSLVSPGSYIEEHAGTSTTGVPGYRYGSGTSQAAAVTSGAAALLLQRRAWTPDEVKAALSAGASRLKAPATDVGAGVIDVANALNSRVDGYRQPRPVRSSSSGDDLDATRGTLRVTGLMCDSLRKQVDGSGCDVVQGRLVALAEVERTLTGQPYPELLPFDAAEYAGTSWYGTSWYSSQWTQGTSWYGTSWYGTSWYGTSWYDASAPEQETRTPLGLALKGTSWYGLWR